MSTYTIKADSVAGSKCFIIYHDDKPLLTIWQEPDCTHLQHITGAEMQAIVDLIRTVDALGGGHMDRYRAANAYLLTLNEKEPK